MQLPSAVRAAVGLVAVAAEEARKFPDRAIELPMLAVSTALQISLRAQQRYARLAARGDEVIHRRPPSEEPPPWATFDEPVGVEELRKAAEHARYEAPAAKPARKPRTPKPTSEGTPPTKRVNAPRHAKPSMFDDAGER
jgi:hypothetical protein